MKKKIYFTDDKWEIYYFIIGLLGLILNVVQIFILRSTIISVIIPIGIILGVSLVTFLLTRRHYNKVYGVSGFMFAFLYSLISWGFISSALFLATNYYFADASLTEHRFLITNKSSLPGSKGDRSNRKPTISIDYFGFNKELVFSPDKTEEVQLADSVTLAVNTGLFGFDIMQDYNLVERTLAK